ncbi:hypothetical protein [Eisenbergiella tayi]|nr:hypothetical protein [Eisenbergiella tayi]
MEIEKDYEKNWVRLPLVFASNVRELGGYPVEEGDRQLITDFCGRMISVS